MITAILPQLPHIAGQLSRNLNPHNLRAKVLPVVSQVFKDNLLFSGAEMEIMAIFLIDYKNTAVAAVHSVYQYAIDELKPNPAPCNLQPCI